MAIIRFSELTNDFRFDPEFFQKEHLAIEVKLKSLNSRRLGDVCELFDGPFGSDLLAEDYSDSGVPLLRMQNITSDGAPNLTDVETISEESAARLSKYHAKPGELVVTKIGFLGHATVLPHTFPLYVFRREMTKCIPRNPDRYSPNILAAFFNGQFGRKQFYRYSSGTTRDRVLLISQRQVLVPEFSFALQRKVDEAQQSAKDAQIKAEKYLESAEQTLLRALGLDAWQPPEPPTYTRRASEAFATGRLDAQFFFPDTMRFVKLLKGASKFENWEKSVKFSKVCLFHTTRMALSRSSALVI